MLENGALLTTSAFASKVEVQATAPQVNNQSGGCFLVPPPPNSGTPRTWRTGSFLSGDIAPAAFCQKRVRRESSREASPTQALLLVPHVRPPTTNIRLRFPFQVCCPPPRPEGGSAATPRSVPEGTKLRRRRHRSSSSRARSSQDREAESRRKVRAAASGSGGSSKKVVMDAVQEDVKAPASEAGLAASGSDGKTGGEQ